jgi:hypothetical protein
LQQKINYCYCDACLEKFPTTGVAIALSVNFWGDAYKGQTMHFLK